MTFETNLQILLLCKKYADISKIKMILELKDIFSETTYMHV